MFSNSQSISSNSQSISWHTVLKFHHLKFIEIFSSQIHDLTTCVFFKECDQVHVEDVASDDNGQELRCVACYTVQLYSTSSHTFCLITHFSVVTRECFSLLLVTTTSWRTALMVPAVEGHQEPPLESREGSSGCGNWPFATAG